MAPITNKSEGTIGGSGQIKKKPQSDEKMRQKSPDIKLEIKPKAAEAGGECPYCGSPHSATAQICPECGMGLGKKECTFCGHLMPASAESCPECGASREGVECPHCGTINFRNFCRSCNRPVTNRGQTALARFQTHPNYRVARKINDKLGVLADFIDGKISRSDSRLAYVFADSDRTEADDHIKPEGKKSSRPLMPGLFGSNKLNDSDRTVTGTESKPITIEEAMRLYEQQKAEMDRLLDSILPDGDFSPEEQRDFYAARMMVVTRTHKKIEERDYWICNFCGFKHRHPQQCAEPWQGGEWVHETKTVEYKTTTLEKLD